MSLEKSPDRGATAWNSLLAHRRNDLVQGQIRLLGYQSQQPFHVLLQRGIWRKAWQLVRYAANAAR